MALGAVKGFAVTFRQLFESAAQRDKVAAFAVEANEQNLNRLEALLAEAG